MTEVSSRWWADWLYTSGEIRKPERVLVWGRRWYRWLWHGGSNTISNSKVRHKVWNLEESPGWKCRVEKARICWPQVTSISLLLHVSLQWVLPIVGFHLADPAQLSLAWNRTLAQCSHPLVLVCGLTDLSFLWLLLAHLQLYTQGFRHAWCTQRAVFSTLLTPEMWDLLGKQPLPWFCLVVKTVYTIPINFKSPILRITVRIQCRATKRQGTSSYISERGQWHTLLKTAHLPGCVLSLESESCKNRAANESKVSGQWKVHWWGGARWLFLRISLML